ncbi:hypothetical protein ES705_30194 [subsurface metagenome]
MSPSEDDFDELERKLDDLESSINDINIDIEELKFIKDYEIYLYPATIERYLDILVKVQQIDKRSFFPSSEVRIEQYFNNNFASFDHANIKYDSTVDFKVISKIISYQGKSGSSFIENVENVIDINKPLLIFYGIEQIAAYFSNLHFNFTWKNNRLTPIRVGLAKHGIDSFEFKNKVDLNNPIEDLLNKKIKLKNGGLAQRFFLTIAPEFLPYFSQKLEIPFIELLKLFFIFSPIPNKTKKTFEDLYGSRKSLPNHLNYMYLKHSKKLILYLIYLLSFLFCHMCRYKLYAWTVLLNSDEKNIGYFIKYFLKYSKRYFIKTVFDEVYKNEQKIKLELKFKKNIS